MNSKAPSTVHSGVVNAKNKPRNPGGKSAIDDAIAALSTRDAQPYDGLLGKPPDWIPSPLKHEFYAVRNRLLDSESLSNVQEWMRLWRSSTKHGWMNVPPDCDRDMEALAYIQRIVNLGSNDGIDAYLGKNGMEVVRNMALVERNRFAAKKPRIDGLQRVILAVLRTKPVGMHANPYVIKMLREKADTEFEGVIIESIEFDSSGNNQREVEIIFWHDAKTKAGKTLLSAIPNRVTRALKKIETEKPG